MPRFDRRSLIGASASLGLLGACSSLSARAGALRRDPFTLGVAAGDPTPDGFVIWTRLAPDPLAPAGGMAPGPVPVAWEVAADAGFRDIVRSGEGLALPQAAHSLHVEVSGLAAQRPYWYRFHAGGAASETGCARTLPAPGAALDQLHIASVGCHDYESGFFTAFDEQPAQRCCKSTEFCRVVRAHFGTDETLLLGVGDDRPRFFVMEFARAFAQA